MQSEPTHASHVAQPISTSVPIPLSNGGFTIVDAEDADMVNEHSWGRLVIKNRSCATRCKMINGKPVTCYLHRVIMNAPPHLMVDHIDFEALNNQRYNLRFATRTQNNAHNRRHPGASGFRGVRKNGGSHSWAAAFSVNGIRRHIGNYSTPEEAARAYDIAAFARYGEFAMLNFPLSQITSGSELLAFE